MANTEKGLLNAIITALETLTIKAGTAIIGKVGIDQTTDGTTNKVSATQDTHDNLNCNSNIQVGNTDVSNSNVVPVLDREAMGKNGGVVIADTNAHTGTFTAILVVSEAVVTAVGDITITALTVPAGIVIPGEFTSITLASGSIIAYGSEDE